MTEQDHINVHERLVSTEVRLDKIDEELSEIKGQLKLLLEAVHQRVGVDRVMGNIGYVVFTVLGALATVVAQHFWPTIGPNHG